MSVPEPHIIRLTPSHAGAYRALMLKAYANDPDAFIATVPEREPLPLAWWETRLCADPAVAQGVFGAFCASELVGVVGFERQERPRTRHKAKLFGMAVLPPYRGRGIARRLVDSVLEQARATPEVRVVQLTVEASNVAARRLYESCGFEPFGTEPMAVRDRDRFFPLVHMWREIHKT